MCVRLAMRYIWRRKEIISQINSNNGNKLVHYQFVKYTLQFDALEIGANESKKWRYGSVCYFQIYLWKRWKDKELYACVCVCVCVSGWLFITAIYHHNHWAVSIVCCKWQNFHSEKCGCEMQEMKKWKANNGKKAPEKKIKIDELLSG